jgi:transcriptional regulator with XRE-family HTH domain
MPQLKSAYAVQILASNVKYHRLRRNLTQEKLAFMAEIEYSQISRIERGVVNTSVSVIFVIAKALDIKPSELLDF